MNNVEKNLRMQKSRKRKNMGRHGRDRKEQKRDQERTDGSMQAKASEKALATFHHKPFYCMDDKKNENKK